MSEENFKQIADQHKSVVHMATVLAGIFFDYENIFRDPKCEAGAKKIASIAGPRSAYLMEVLGNILNNMDAVLEDEDEWLKPIFENAHRLYPEAAKQCFDSSP